jgi:hypothetical protein
MPVMGRFGSLWLHLPGSNVEWCPFADCIQSVLRIDLRVMGRYFLGKLIHRMGCGFNQVSCF